MPTKPNKMMISIESWNHFKDKPFYTIGWGPFDLSTKEIIKNKIIKNFAPGVKYVMYSHQEESLSNYKTTII